MGFQDMKPIVHQQASRKGGKVRKAKGLAKLSPDKRREIASMGGKASANRNKEDAKQDTRDRGDDSQRLADILGNING